MTESGKSDLRYLKEMSVLFVDDDILALKQMERFIPPYVGTFYTARNGREGLSAFSRYHPEIVITDIQMPEVNGIEMARAIHAENPRLPIIVVTSFEDTEYLIEAIEIGVRRYVLKPIDPGKLISTLSQCAEEIGKDRIIEEQRHLNEVMLNSLPIPTMILDTRNRTILSANDYARRLGFTAGSECTGLFFANDVFVSFCESCADASTPLNRSFRVPETSAFGRIWEITFNQVTKDKPLFFAMDITERKRLERLREDVERIVRHDMKSSLTAVLGFSELILRGLASPEDQYRYVSMIHQGGRKMLRMINHSLDLFKMEEGIYVLNPCEFDLIPVLHRIDSELRSIGESKFSEVRYLIDDEPLTPERTHLFYGEEWHIESLLTNLIKNALEAAPAETTVTVSLKGGPFQEVDIHNFGAIPEDIRDRFFERYSTSGKKYGTGLGTYSAKLIAAVHGGDIAFTTSEAQGTHVVVTLPRKDIQDSRIDQSDG